MYQSRFLSVLVFTVLTAAAQAGVLSGVLFPDGLPLAQGIDSATLEKKGICYDGPVQTAYPREAAVTTSGSSTRFYDAEVVRGFLMGRAPYDSRHQKQELAASPEFKAASELLLGDYKSGVGYLYYGFGQDSSQSLYSTADVTPLGLSAGRANWARDCGNAHVAEVTRGGRLLIAFRIDSESNEVNSLLYDPLGQLASVPRGIVTMGKWAKGKSYTPRGETGPRPNGTKVTVAAVQVGGHPEKLYEIFGQEPQQANTWMTVTSKACNIQALAPCLEVAETLSKYSGEELPQDIADAPAFLSYRIANF